MGVEVGDGSGFGGLGAGGFACEVELGLDLRKGEGYGVWIAELGDGVDPWAAGIAEAEELGDFVIGFAGRIVERAADERVLPGVGDGAGKIEVRVATGDDQGESWFVRNGSVAGCPSACPEPVEGGIASETWDPANPSSRSFKSTAWMWPSRWLTAMSGRPVAKARALA